jgi:hypothetical protein
VLALRNLVAALLYAAKHGKLEQAKHDLHWPVVDAQVALRMAEMNNASGQVSSKACHAQACVALNGGGK